jgi:glycogen operon protein
MSWNCGIEGPTDDSSIERLRNRQVKNFFAITLLAAGAPMLLMGDEIRRTQRGNNNAYGQDNEISWFDWDLVGKHADVLRFARRLIAGRLQRDVSREDPGMTLNQLLHQSKIAWHGVKLNQPDWGGDSHAIALNMRSLRDRFVIHIMINAYWEQLEFEVPPVVEFSGHDWKRWIDTSRESPDDISSWSEAVTVRNSVVPVQSRSVVALVSRIKNRGKR